MKGKKTGTMIIAFICFNTLMTFIYFQCPEMTSVYDGAKFTLVNLPSNRTESMTQMVFLWFLHFSCYLDSQILMFRKIMLKYLKIFLTRKVE